ncbi:MAG: tyrosine-protein phosphatase, partial [Acidimicrobiales bacterium]
MPQHHPLEGCLNLRDIGGYPAVTGRMVRTGCLFRSDELCALTDEDLVAVTRLGIKVVFDLRHHGERQARPSRLPPDVELLERRTEPTEGAAVTIEEQIATASLPERDDSWMGKIYAELLEHMAPDFRVIVERAAEARARPLLFHCAAGKDRTGLTAAILLGLLGVPDEVILDDYELTNDHYTPGRLSALEP